jgi:hypothetical protein
LSVFVTRAWRFCCPKTDKNVHPTRRIDVQREGSMFNLQAPPGFHGLDPHISVRMYSRHLPHWRQQGATYFVTFRLEDALPQEKVQELRSLKKAWETSHPPRRSEKDWEDFARKITVKSEQQQESYDRIVRDEEHLYRVVQYIGRNPSMAGIPRERWLRWIDPSWRAAGRVRS